MSVSPERPATNETRSIGELLKELRDETTLLFRQEIALAKQEMSEKATTTGVNIGYLAGGGLVAYAGFLCVLVALSIGIGLLLVEAGLTAETAQWLAPAIVGIVVSLIGLGMMAKAKKTLQNISPTPERTIESLKEDKQWVKEKLR